MKNLLQKHLLIGLVILLAIAGGPVLTAIPAQAAPPALPPRPEPPPTNPSTGSQDNDDGSGGQDEQVGAYIRLQVEAAQSGLQAGVQWQDSAGGWHAVESWQGPVSAGGTQQWWVAPKDFNTGPFRWVVGQGAATSSPFNLPQQGNSVLQINLTLN